MDKDNFGKWLRLMRIRNGLSQQDLANELQVDQTTVSRLERGAQSLSASIAASIAKLFGLSIDEVWAAADPGAGESGDITITPPRTFPIPAAYPESGIVGAVSASSMSIIRRVESLPVGDRRLALMLIRAILTVVEDEAERATISEQLKETGNNGE